MSWCCVTDTCGGAGCPLALATVRRAGCSGVRATGRLENFNAFKKPQLGYFFRKLLMKIDLLVLKQRQKRD